MKLINELLGVRYPIIQGGMANIATGKFAAAVSNAGALGLIASGGMPAEALEKEIFDARQATDQPFGVNLMLMNPDADNIADLLAKEKIGIITIPQGQEPPVNISKNGRRPEQRSFPSLQVRRWHVR